jgi:glycosyltransferase involved in cell wall biosynthesis
LSFLLNWREYIHKNGKKYEYDLMIGDVVEEAKKYFNVACLDNPAIRFSTPFRSFKATKNKFNKSDDWICVEQFIDISDIFKAFSRYIKYLFRPKRDEEIYQLFSIFNNSPKFNSSRFNILLNLIISERILSYVKPKMLFFTCEYDQFHRELTYIAHKKNIPVIALQHGVITSVHPGYIFNNSNMQLVLSDITFVSGKYHYNLLTKNSIYKPEHVAVTGLPRYDILYHANKIYDRKSFCNKWGLDPNRKIALVATENLPIHEENIIFLKIILKSLKEFPILQVVVKPHPGEIGKWYEKVVKEKETGVTILPKNSDTYEALYACDLFFIYASTTAMEAVVLNKPVIAVNLTGRPDHVEYVKEGVALGVYKEEDLKPTIEKLLKDDSELAQNRRRYIEKYLYKIDGRATERVVNLIGEMIEKSKGGKNKNYIYE